MTGPVVECVPNFSEGTDARRVEAIVAAMRVEGVHLLDWSMDTDHNRSVVTIAGEPAAVVEAAVRGAGKAAELIDLTRQQGASSPHRRRRRHSLRARFRHQAGAVRHAGAPGGPRNLATLRHPRLLLRSRSLAARSRQPRRRAPGPVRRACARPSARTPLGAPTSAAPDCIPPPEPAPSARASSSSPTTSTSIRPTWPWPAPSLARSAPRLWRPERRKGHGRARPRPGAALHEHHRLSRPRRSPRCTRPSPRLAARHKTAPVEGEVIGLIPEAACERESEWMRQLIGFDPAAKILENRLASPWRGQTGVE